MDYKIIISMGVLILFGLCVSENKIIEKNESVNNSDQETDITNGTVVSMSEVPATTFINVSAGKQTTNESPYMRPYERRTLPAENNKSDPPIQQIWVLETGEPKIITSGKYQYLFLPNVPNITLLPDRGELMIPRELTTVAYPLRTIVFNYSIISLEDPVDLIIPNMSVWEGKPVSRLDDEGMCPRHNSSVNLLYKYTYMENSMLIGLTFVPVEVVDCEKGVFRVYRRIKYGIKYYAYSPVLLRFKGITNQGGVDGKQTASVVVESIVDRPASGMLFMDSEKGKRLFGEEITIAGGQAEDYNISFVIPMDEGRYTYDIGFMQDNDKKTELTFSAVNPRLKFEVYTPKRMYEEQDLSAYVKITNEQNRQVNVYFDIRAKDSSNMGPALKKGQANMDPGTSVNYSYYNLSKLKPGTYTIRTEYSSSSRPENQVILGNLNVEDLGPECKEQGSFNLLNAVNTKGTHKAYCTDSKIALLLNLTNNGSSEEYVEAEYVNDLLQPNGQAVSVGTPKEEYYKTSAGKFSAPVVVPAQSNRVVAYDLALKK